MLPQVKLQGSYYDHITWIAGRYFIPLDISSWNSLFVGSNAVADQMAKKYDLSKAELLKRDDAAVQLALGESQIVNDIKDYLINHGKGFIPKCLGRRECKEGSFNWIECWKVRLCLDHQHDHDRETFFVEISVTLPVTEFYLHLTSMNPTMMIPQAVPRTSLHRLSVVSAMQNQIPFHQDEAVVFYLLYESNPFVHINRKTRALLLYL